MYITLTSLYISYLYYNILQTLKSVCIYFSFSTIVVQKQNYRLIVVMLTYHHEKYVQIYLMVLLTKSTTVFSLVVHLFNPLIAKPLHTITQQKSQGCLVVNAAVQENPQNIPQMTKNIRNISCQNQFFLLNIKASHLMSSK